MTPYIDRSPRPLLFDTLSVLLPTAEQTWFLRACLHSGEAGSEAWKAWLDRVDNPKRALAEDGRGVKQLLPLLYRALQDNGVTVGRELLSYLRIAYVHEGLRSQTYRRIFCDVTGALTATEIRFLLLDGAALAGTVYGEWALRHCGRLDLLVKGQDLECAIKALRAVGLSYSDKGTHPEAGATRLEHKSGLPIVVHCDLFPIPYYQAPLDRICARGIQTQIAGVPLRILAPPDMLLQVCGWAACLGTRGSLHWVCDAWHIVHQCDQFDWDVLVDDALYSRLALPLAVMYHYLVGALDAPIPAPVLHRLTDASTETSTLACEAALSGARAGTQGTFGNLLGRSSSWLARAVVLKWMLFPSPSCLQWTYSIPSPWLLPLFYIYRTFRYLIRRLSLG